MTSSVGSIKNLPIYQQYYQYYQEYNQKNNRNLTFDAYLDLAGYKQYFLEQIENYIETGNPNGGDGKKGNTISNTRYINNGNSSIYQSADDETYYEFDFDKGTYTVHQGNDSVAALLGLSGKDYDTIQFGYQTANVTNYTFGDLEDGQDSSTIKDNSPYFYNVSYNTQEFDIHYVLNGLLMNPDDPQYQIATEIFNNLIDTMHQWCPQSDLQALDAIAAQYGTESAEYKEKLKEVILNNLDQANEWIEDHDHLEYKVDASVNLGAEQEGGTQENKPPEYDKTKVLSAAGLSGLYNSDYMWSGGWHEKGSKDECQERAKGDAITQLSAYISQLATALRAQIGDAWTQEMEDYLAKVEAYIYDGFFITDDEDICDNGKIKTNDWATTDCKGGGGGDFRAIISVQNLTDAFFAEFDRLCKAGGKTQAEIDAEKAEKEKKKSNYQSLYGANLNSIATSAGIKDVTVVPTGSNQYYDIQEKAESEVVQPLIDELKGKYPNIPEAELLELLEAAGTAALANPNAWATTTNNYTYTIDADALIDIFEEYVKEGIKSKGYEF